MHYFRDNIIFLDEMACALRMTEGKSVFFAIIEGKRVIVILKPKFQLTLLHSLVVENFVKKKGNLYS